MKKIHYCIITTLLAVIVTLVACHENIIDETYAENNEGKIEKIIVRGNVDSDIKNLSVQTILETELINQKNFEISSVASEMPQLFYVDDINGNTILMARGFYNSNQIVDINSQTTTIALVTLHPLFAPITGNDFTELVSLIKASSCYQDLYEEVDKSIRNGQNIFDTSNIELLLALSNLFEDLCSYSGVNTRGHISNWEQLNIQNPHPFLIEINDNVMSITNIALSPRYDGTVSHNSIGVQQLTIPTREGYGGWELIKQAAYGWSSGAFGDLANGKPVNFDFTINGQYKFEFKRNEFDYYYNVIRDVVKDAGIPWVKDKLINTFIEDVAERAQVNGVLSISTTDPIDLLHGLTKSIVTYLIEFKSTSEGIEFHKQFPQAENFLKKALTALKAFSCIKVATNSLLRLVWLMKAPETVKFCLCYYAGEVTSCTETTLYPVRETNNQTGFAKQRLLLPIKVLVHSIAEDGTLVENSFQKVKFEVISGGGIIDASIVDTDESGFAETNWTLGESGNQKIRAVVIDVITGQEISNEAIFTATLRENADLTVRLEWEKSSGNTDIDLHVTDPYGEEIAYYNMTSASGGMLDRDDRVGPGPEHIFWSKTPSGAYLVQVHYFGSETGAITSYTVSINASNKNYGPFKGSISDQQLVTIGVLNLPEGIFTRTYGDNIFFEEQYKVEDNVVFPAKK